MEFTELNRNEISHLDIKPNNVVLHNNYFKFIDFGLSNKFSDLKHFEQKVIMNHEQVVYIYGIHLNFYGLQCTKAELVK